MREPFDHLLDQLDWRPTGAAASGAKRYATHVGFLRLGGHEVKVYQLNTGERVFDAKSCESLLGMSVQEMADKLNTPK